nr:OadG family protein [uncultured Desulfobulbus sp.]
MIAEGMKLTLLGVGVVYLFLSLLVVVIKVASRVLKPLTDKEEAAYHALPVKKTVSRRAEEEMQRVMAVINAAITAHQERKAAAALFQERTQSIAATSASLPGGSMQLTESQKYREPRRRPYRAGELFLRDRSTLAGYLYHR